MVCRGTVKDGVVVLDEGVKLPEGAAVNVEVTEEPSEEQGPSWAEVFKDVIGKAEGLPEDLALNHDHYLHGAPKRK